MTSISFHTEVETLQAEIAGVVDEIAWTMDSPLPKEEVKQRLATSAKEFSDKFGLNLSRLANPSAGPLELREALTVHERVRIRSESVGVEPLHIDLSGILFAVFSDDLIKHLAKQIDALDYTAGPPTKERGAALTKLRDTLRQLEQKEERLICNAEAAGVYIERRPDANPAIVLSYDPAGSMDELLLPARCHAAN